jgi:CARDB
VKSVQLGPCQPNGTRQWTFQVAIRNVGAGPAMKKETKYAWVRAQAVVDGVPLNKSSSAAVSTLGPGQAVPFSLTLTVKEGPTSYPGAKEEGTVLVMVDPDGVIKEASEGNNTRTQKWYASMACAKP